MVNIKLNGAVVYRATSPESARHLIEVFAKYEYMRSERGQTYERALQYERDQESRLMIELKKYNIIDDIKALYTIEIEG